MYIALSERSCACIGTRHCYTICYSRLDEGDGVAMVMAAPSIHPIAKPAVVYQNNRAADPALSIDVGTSGSSSLSTNR